MSMTAAEIQYTFKVVGKAVQMGVSGAATSDQYQSLSSVTNRQISPSGINTEYDEIKYIGTPLQSQCESISQVGLSQRETMKTLVSAFMQNSLCNNLGLTPGTNPNTVAAALATEMTVRSQTVGTSGSKTADQSFAVYFFNNFAATLPQSASPTCPDTWITPVMVP
jgi:hypothetical protein